MPPIRTESPELAPQSADPLDHLADVLFHKMGTDGVYARTALYEDVVERLAALITRNREPSTEVMRFPPVMNRGAAREVGLPQELSEPARLRLRPARHRTRDQRRGRAASTPAATGPRRCRRPTSCCRRPPAIPSIRSRPAAASCPRAACASTSRPIASAASRRAISTACNRSGCANMSASARPTTSPISASAGW